MFLTQFEARLIHNFLTKDIITYPMCDSEIDFFFFFQNIEKKKPNKSIDRRVTSNIC